MKQPATTTRRFLALNIRARKRMTQMTKRRALYAIGLAFCGGVWALGAEMAAGQFVAPDPKPPDGATLFRQQCATCHTTGPVEPVR
jgi:cytochrome c